MSTTTISTPANWADLRQPVTVDNPEYPGHPYRFDPVTNTIEAWQSHAHEWRTVVTLTPSSIAAMAEASCRLEAAERNAGPDGATLCPCGHRYHAYDVCSICACVDGFEAARS